jgi:hypothetical protein
MTLQILYQFGNGYNGPVIPQSTAATNLTAGQPLMLNAAGDFVAHDGSAAPVAGYAPSGGVIAGQVFSPQPASGASGFDPALTPGATYYVQPGGALGTTPTAAYAGQANGDGTALIAAPAAATAASLTTRLKKDGTDIGATSVIQQFTMGVKADGITINKTGAGQIAISQGVDPANTATNSIIIGGAGGTSSGITGLGTIVVGGYGSGVNSAAPNSLVIGNLSLKNNTATTGYPLAFGPNVGNANSGVNLLTMGGGSGNTNSGDSFIAIGFSTGNGNTFNNAFALGNSATPLKDGQIACGAVYTSIKLPGQITLNQALPSYATHAAAVADPLLPARTFYFNTTTVTPGYKP